MLRSIIKDSPDRCMITSHHPFHPIDSTDHVALIDHIASADPDKQVLRMICHSDDFMRNHLTNRYYQIQLGILHHPVDFNGNTVSPQTFSHFRNKGSRNLSYLYDIMTPVMSMKKRMRYIPTH